MVKDDWAQIGEKTAFCYLRNSLEQSRNPQFNPYPPTIACGLYNVMRPLVEKVMFPDYSNGGRSKIIAVAVEAICFMGGLAVSGMLLSSLGYRPSTWIRDLALYAASTSVTKAALAYKSSRLIVISFILNSLSRNLLERSRNPFVDAVSLTIPTILSTGASLFLVKPAAKRIGVEEKYVRVVLPLFLAWSLTPTVCSLVGRKVVYYPTVMLMAQILIRLRSLIPYS